MTKVIALSNHKGGVGKTTSTVNIGAGLAQKGKRVLLIDMDPQANLSQCFGVQEPEFTIYGALVGEHELKPYEVRENLHVVPSTLDLAGAEVELASKIARETILKKLVEKIKDQYDYILIDCAPSLGLITINAFAATDEIYIPLQAQFLALHGLDKLQDIVELVRENINPRLHISGVFTTQFDGRKVLNRDIADLVHEHFKDKAFKTVIRDNVTLAEAPSHWQDIFTYSPKCNGAQDYAALVDEILERQELSKAV
ncbi:ParA family protein [Cesiribacter sp. SM1]|uniref:ParA family protein n=1 Tax=Cesiribacter sp. SM1 TaxID=2861196 RepID=UPI001CD762A3|nr:AAA family ATPase [Cesiribacter sp. SM1]